MSQSAPVDIPGAPSRRRAAGGRIALVGLLVAACGYFFVRGPLRAARVSVDLPVFYSSARAWALGGNPYEAEDLRLRLREGGGGDFAVPLSLNPPATFPVLAPLGLLSYPAAKYVLIVVNVLLTAVVLYLALGLAGLPARRERTLLFLAFALALAPFHTAISQGQLTIIVTACLAGALWCDVRGRDLLAGALLGLAGALKPQMAVLLGLFYAVRLRWRVCLAGAAAVAVLMGAGIARLELAGVPWLAAWTGNLRAFTAGGTGDPLAPDAGRYLMINLHVLLHNFLGDRTVVSGLVIAFGAAGLACVAGLERRLAPGDRALWGYSALSVLTLLAAYHRLYSATLLVLPLTWAIGSIRSGRKGIPVACMILIGTFLVPGAAALRVLTKRGMFPEAVAKAWYWDAVVMPHQTYALVALAACLIWAGARWRDRGTD